MPVTKSDSGQSGHFLMKKRHFYTENVEDMNYKSSIDVKLTGIAKGVGVEFKKK